VNRYTASVFIFIFISFATGCVLFGLIDLAAYILNFSDKFILLLDLASVVISIYVGLHIAFNRFKKNKPWNLTPLNKSIIFVFLFLAIQLTFETVLYGIFSRVLGGGSLPPMSIIYFLAISNHITHLPMSALSDKFLTPWAEHLYFIILFVNSIIWAAFFYLLLRVAAKIKSHHVNNPPRSDKSKTGFFGT